MPAGCAAADAAPLGADHKAATCPDEIGTEVAQLLQERHHQLMKSIDLWLRHEEDMVQVLLRQPRDGPGLLGTSISSPNGEKEVADSNRSDGAAPPSPSSEKEAVQACSSLQLSEDGACAKRDHEQDQEGKKAVPVPKPKRGKNGSSRGGFVCRSWTEDDKGLHQVVAAGRARNNRKAVKVGTKVMTQWHSMFSRPGDAFDDEEYMNLALRRARTRESTVSESARDEDEEPKAKSWRERTQDLVGSPAFTGLVFIVILTNILLVGIETDYSAGGLGSLNEVGDRAFWALSVLYTLLFSVELVMRVIADGCAFFYRDNMFWNWFETLIVVLSVVDCILSGVSLGSSTSIMGGQSWVIRLFRVVRILRTLRIVRVVSFIREVVLVIQSITATVKSLVWAMVLLLLMLYGFGIIFTQAVSDFRNSEADYDDAFLTRHWSTLPRSIFSLFEAVTGGVSWLEILQPLSDVSWGLIALFVVFFIFTYFCLLNVMTAIFCQNAIESATSDKELASLALMSKKLQLSEEMRRIFLDMDKDHTGAVDVEEFEKYLSDDRMRAFLASREIDVHDAWTLFRLLDHSQSGVIEIEEFVEGLLQLRGPAKAMQIAKVMHDGRIMRHQLQAHMMKVEERLEILVKDARLPSFGPLSSSGSWASPSRASRTSRTSEQLECSLEQDVHSRKSHPRGRVHFADDDDNSRSSRGAQPAVEGQQQPLYRLSAEERAGPLIEDPDAPMEPDSIHLSRPRGEAVKPCPVGCSRWIAPAEPQRPRCPRAPSKRAPVEDAEEYAGFRL